MKTFLIGVGAAGNKAVVDAHGVYYAPVCTSIKVCACVHIYTAWVSALLIRDFRFSQDLRKRISK